MILSKNSTTDTCAPSLKYTCPNSIPITPPPIIIKCLGTSGNFKASVDVMILSLSNLIKGKEDGFEPVAIIIFLPSITSEVPSALVTLILVLLSKEPNPSKTVILFLSIRNLTPPDV